MSLFDGGVMPDAIYVGGVADTYVLSGTGNGVVENWPYWDHQDFNYDFSRANEDRWFAISGFDGRTAANSKLNPGIVIGGSYRPQVNVDHTHHFRLINRQFNGNLLIMQVQADAQLFSLAVPSSLVLASNLYGNLALIMEYGNNGIRLFPISGSNIQTQYRTEILTPIAPGDIIKVIWSRSGITIYVNGNVIGNIYEPAFYTTFRNAPGVMYPGFGVYSGPSSTWSTPIPKVWIAGTTSMGPEMTAQAYFQRIEIPVSTWTEVARIQHTMGGTATIQLISVAWAAPTSFSTRNWRVKVNGTVVGTITDQNGSGLTVNNVNIPVNSLITVEGYSSSSASPSNKTVASGLIRVT